MNNHKISRQKTLYRFKGDLHWATFTMSIEIQENKLNRLRSE